MPCITEHYGPSERDIAYKKARNLTNYVKKHIDIPAEGHCKYSNGNNPETRLCAIIRGMTKEQKETIVYNAKSKMSRKLADWWEEHLKDDKKREQEKKAEKKRQALEKQALAKLTAKEKKALGF